VRGEGEQELAIFTPGLPLLCSAVQWYRKMLAVMPSVSRNLKILRSSGVSKVN
jgi:hypothetical protein